MIGLAAEYLRHGRAVVGYTASYHVDVSFSTVREYAVKFPLGIARRNFILVAEYYREVKKKLGYSPWITRTNSCDDLLVWDKNCGIIILHSSPNL